MKKNFINLMYLHPIVTCAQAKSLPCVFNNWCAFCDRKFLSVNLLSADSVRQLLKK